MTEKIGVIGTPGKWSTEALADALEARTGYRQVIDMARVTLDLETRALVCNGVDLCALDGLVVKKIAETYSPDALDRLEMLRVAEAKGVKIFSPATAILRLMDRLACTVTLANAKVPMPPTTITEDVTAARAALDRYGSAVFKPLFSTKARGMVLLDADAPDAEAQIAAFKAANPVMYLQKKADLSGHDLGMVFLGGAYLCTYARVSQTGSWNTTIHSGGKGEPHRGRDRGGAGRGSALRRASAGLEIGQRLPPAAGRGREPFRSGRARREPPAGRGRCGEGRHADRARGPRRLVPACLRAARHPATGRGRRALDVPRPRVTSLLQGPW